MKRRPIAILKFTQGHLEPWARVDRDAMSEWKEGAIVECHPYNDKRGIQNRLLHGMLGIAAENSEGWTIESLKFEIKIRGGWVNGVVVRRNGEVYQEVRSTADFSEDEMGYFIDEAKDFISTEILPGLDIDTLIEEAKARSAVTKVTRT